MTDSQVPKPRRTSSPAAPGIPLQQAIAEVSRAYQRYGHGSFTKGELGAALEMSSGGGAFLSKLATLRDYGLLDDGSQGQLKVSDLFKALHQAPPGSSELRGHASQAIAHSAIFRRLLRQFSARIPDESAIALRLESQDRFNPDRARVVAGAFRTSLKDYGLIDPSGNVLPVRDEPSPVAVASVADDLLQSQVPDRLDDDIFRVEVPLGDRRRAILILPVDLAEGDIRRMTAVLRGFLA